MDADMAGMLVGCGYAQLATLLPSEAKDAVTGLNRAFDYYVEIGDLDSAVAAAEYPRATTSGTTPGTAELVERALRLVSPDSLPECRLLLRHGWDLGRMRGDYPGAQEAFHRALTIASGNGNKFLEMESLAAAAEVDVFNLACQEAMVKSRRVIELVYEGDDPWAEVQAHQRATLACTIIGDLEGARHHASAALAPAERLHDLFWLTSSLWGKQFVHRMEGNWEAARETSDRLLSLSETPRHLSERVMLEYQQGDFAQGKFYLDRLLEVHRQMRPGQTTAYVMPALIIPLAYRIDPKADHLEYAQSFAEEVITSASAPPLITSVARAGLALMAVFRRDETAAQEHYSALLVLGGTMLHTGVIAADRVLGLLSETVGKPDQAQRHFEDALVLCQRAGFLPEYCWCAYDLANSLLRTDQADKRDKATILLDEALTVTSRLGMLPLTELILNLQASIASSPANYDRLTRRELDVLRLLAIGESNREIARELVLSVRTVERHVTNIYAKIDARGRADATAYALRQGISGSP
jgi:ATP/maltotriose-dependent transcriptional regulator MalT